MVQIKHQELQSPKAADVPTDETPVALPVLNPEVEFELPDGRKIKMAKPAIPSALLMPTLLGSSEPNIMSAFATEQLVKAVLFVRSIDNRPTQQVESYKDIQSICIQLGEQGIDAVLLMYNKVFPPLTEKQLKIIKK